MPNEQNILLSIQASQPLWVGSIVVDDQISFKQDSYSHEILANGGYDKASFTITDRQQKLEDWYENGIGRHIEIFNESLRKIGEYFVNEVKINLGGFSATRGPLLNVRNRVTGVYQTASYNTNPPIGGVQARTSTANDTNSQGLYGIREITLDIGEGRTQTEANQVRGTYLREYKDPETTESLSPGAGSGPNVEVVCLGYYHLLDYIYSQTANTGTQNLRAKIRAVLDAEPNSIFSNDYTSVATNALQVPQYDDEEKEAWSIIQDLVARGDSSDNRYIFQILNERKAYYNAVPTTFEYQYALSDPQQKIEKYNAGYRVFPWNVEAGKWILISDFLVGSTIPSNIRQDKRAIFIESVSFSAAYGLDIKGGKVQSLPQKIARLGIGGI